MTGIIVGLGSAGQADLIDPTVWAPSPPLVLPWGGRAIAPAVLAGLANKDLRLRVLGLYNLNSWGCFLEKGEARNCIKGFRVYGLGYGWHGGMFSSALAACPYPCHPRAKWLTKS